jgi:integrase
MSRQFALIVDEYIEEKRAVGYSYVKAARGLKEVVALHERMECDGPSLPKALAEAFMERRPNEKESTRLNRASIIRGLGEYMARMGYQAYIAPRKQGWVRRESYQPYIFTDGEIRRLFLATETACPMIRDFRRAQYVLAFWLLYSTGMRVGEVCNLKKCDVDLDEGMITVRHAKNDKDRKVPVCASVLKRLRNYWDKMSLEAFWSKGISLFAQPGGGALTQRSVYTFFRQCLWAAKISHGGKGKGPRVHDIRFTYSCHKLREWVRSGADINALLPYLATYMGHADTRCTEYYLRLTADLYPTITAMVEVSCSWMIPEGSLDGQP